MEYKIAEHIRIKASLAVQVIDDFNNRIIQDSSIQVSIEGSPKPVRKSDGYYVFINLTQPKVNLTVKGACYTTQTQSIDLETLSRTDPVVKVRIKPNIYYPLPRGTTSLTGLAEPNSEIRVVCNKSPKYYRLLYDYAPQENNQEIHIYNPEKLDLDGKILQISNEFSESFEILSTVSRDENIYHMVQPLEHTYKKAGTKIFPIFVTQADETGEYFLPLVNPGEEALCWYEKPGSDGKSALSGNGGNSVIPEESGQSKSILLEAGKRNRLDFRLR